VADGGANLFEVELQVGYRVIMRKAHACGGTEWEITRTGADIGMRCLKCGRRVMIEREQFERQVKRVEAAEDGHQ